MKLPQSLKRKRLSLAAMVCLALVAGCSARLSGTGPVDFRDVPLNHKELTAGPFRLTTFSRIYNVNEPIVVYVEGDVRDWAPPIPPGANESLNEHLGLRLAAIDPSDNVIFISRPCQFGIDDPVCRYKTWEEGRWAEQVYASMTRALDHLLAAVPHPRLHLVGYSGGGAIAAVMASRRRDVLTLRTIAGNLDPNGNVQNQSNLLGNDFIDPVSLAPKLAHLPQRHFVGGKNMIVPPFLTENFVRAQGPNLCTTVTRVPEASHDTGWEEIWERTVKTIPKCSIKPLTDEDE